MRYGGNTTCLLLEHGSEKVVIDGGSGIMPLGRQLMEQSEQGMLSLFLTHAHWDHVLGLPFFKPLYSAGYRVNVYGASTENRRLDDLLATQHADRFFPIRFHELAADIRIRTLSGGETVSLPGIEVSTMQLNHPGLDLGYRFQTKSGVFVMLTDLAPIANNVLGHGMQDTGKCEKDVATCYTDALTEFVRGADVVVHDTNFTDQEIEGKVHWGHSTPSHALALLSALDQKPALVLSHHDPAHSDDFMDGFYDETRARGRELGVDVMVAREGWSFTV
jgi:ribonuclease BN (tRNA processing enzyme)